MTQVAKITTTIEFNEGSHLFDTQVTDLNVNPSFVQFHLYQYFKQTATTAELWADLFEDGKRLYRFILDMSQERFANQFVQYVFWDNNGLTVRSRVLGENKTHIKLVVDESTEETKIISKTEAL